MKPRSEAIHFCHLLLLVCLLRVQQVTAQSCPTNLRTQRASETATQVSWTIPGVPSNGEGYRLVYKLSGSGSLGMNSGTVAASSGEAGTSYNLLVDGLVPSQAYEFVLEFVGVDNPPSCSAVPLPSNPVGAATIPAPTGVSADVIGPMDVELFWMAQSMTSTVSLVCYTSSDNLIVLTTYQAGEVSIRLGDRNAAFMANIEYTCLVAEIVTSNGLRFGPSASVTFQMDESLPTEPLNFQATVLGSSSIQVTWDTPDPANGVITHYTLYISIGTNQQQQRIISSLVTEYIVNELPAYQLVIVALSASTSIGVGPRTPMVQVRTEDAEPGPVSELAVQPLSPSSLFITWARPDLPNGNLTGYTLIVSNGTSLVRTVEVAVEQEMEGFIVWRVNNLEPYIEYTVDVKALGSGGIGAPLTTTVFTLESVPEEVEIISLERIDENTFQVIWRGENPRGGISGFLVSYEPVYSASDSCGRLESNLTLGEGRFTTTFSGLSRDLAYAVIVTAYNSVGLGPSSQRMTVPPFVSKSDTVPLTSFAQLRLSGVEDCTQWIGQSGISGESIRNAILSQFSLICASCSFTSEVWLTEPTLQCSGYPDQFVFRARLEKCDAECAAHLEFFVSQENGFLLAPTGGILLSDSTCNVYTSSLDSGECTVKTVVPPTTDPLSPMPYSIEVLAGSLAAGVVVGILIGIAATSIIACIVRHSSANNQRKQQEAKMRYERQRFSDNPYEPISIRGRRVGAHARGAESEYSASSPVSKSTTFTTVPEDAPLDFMEGGTVMITHTPKSNCSATHTPKSNRSTTRKPKPKQKSKETRSEFKAPDFSIPLPTPHSAKGLNHTLPSDDFSIPASVLHPQLPPASRSALPATEGGSLSKGNKSRLATHVQRPPKKKARKEDEEPIMRQSRKEDASMDSRRGHSHSGSQSATRSKVPLTMSSSIEKFHQADGITRQNPLWVNSSLMSVDNFEDDEDTSTESSSS